MQRAKSRHFHRSALLACMLLSVLAACAPKDYPEDTSTTPISELPTPEIIPLQEILDLTQDPLADADDPDPDLAQRGEALRTRADAIRAQDL